jgi:hypothetical protein
MCIVVRAVRYVTPCCLADKPTSVSNQLDSIFLYHEDADRLVCGYHTVRCHSRHMKAFCSVFKTCLEKGNIKY